MASSDKFKLYIVYSDKCLNDILNLIIANTSSPSEIGPLRKDFLRHIKTGRYKENNRRFVILSDSVYQDLQKSGCSDENSDFYIERFEIRRENNSPKDCTSNLYFPPGNANKIVNKIIFLKDIGLFDSDDYHIHDTVIEFSNRVSEYTRIIVKIILDTVECRVSWCRKEAFRKIKNRF